MPGIVSWITIRKTLIRIDRHLRKFAGAGIMELPYPALLPDLHRQLDTVGCTIFFFYFYRDRYSYFFLILDRDRSAFRRIILHIVYPGNRLVDLPVIEEPASPEPV